MSVVKQIELNDNYINNIVWCSIDPESGDIVPYPVEISEKIETSFSNGEKILVIPEFRYIQLNFKEMIQTTETGLRSIFREKFNTILEKKVIYNKKYKAWHINREITQLGFCVDISSSMQSAYKGLIETGMEHFIEEQKTIDNKVLLYGYTFSSIINTLYKGDSLKELHTLKDDYLSYKPHGTTACYDAVIKMIDDIMNSYQYGNEVVVCIITDGMDNSSENTKSDMILKINECKKMGWHFIILGTNNFDVVYNNNYADKNCCLNIGITLEEKRHAFRSVSDSLTRARSGQSTSVEFSTLERSQSYNTDNLTNTVSRRKKLQRV